MLLHLQDQKQKQNYTALLQNYSALLLLQKLLVFAVASVHTGAPFNTGSPVVTYVF